MTQVEKKMTNQPSMQNYKLLECRYLATEIKQTAVNQNGFP